MSATPRPWRIENTAARVPMIVPPDSFSCLAAVTPSTNAKANAELICRAVNSHEELVSSIENVLPWICKLIAAHNGILPNDGLQALNALETALAKAKEGSK